MIFVFHYMTLWKPSFKQNFKADDKLNIIWKLMAKKMYFSQKVWVTLNLFQCGNAIKSLQQINKMFY